MIFFVVTLKLESWSGKVWYIDYTYKQSKGYITLGKTIKKGLFVNNKIFSFILFCLLSIEYTQSNAISCVSCIQFQLHLSFYKIVLFICQSTDKSPKSQIHQFFICPKKRGPIFRNKSIWNYHHKYFSDIKALCFL